MNKIKITLFGMILLFSLITLFTSGLISIQTNDFMEMNVHLQPPQQKEDTSFSMVTASSSEYAVLSIDNYTIPKGGSDHGLLSITNVSDCVIITTNITFDPTVIHVKNIDDSSSPFSMTLSKINNSMGYVKLNIYKFGAGLTGDFDICSIELEAAPGAVDGDVTNLSFRQTALWNSSLEVMCFHVEPGMAMVYETQLPDESVIAVDDISIDVGEQEGTDIDLINVTDCVIITMNLTWDPSVADLVHVNDSSIPFDLLLTTVDQQNGSLKLSAYKFGDGLTGDFTVCHVRFEAASGAVDGDWSALHIRNSAIWNESSEMIPHSTVNGSITIRDTTSPPCELAIQKAVKTCDDETYYDTGVTISPIDERWVIFNITITANGSFDTIHVFDEIPYGLTYNQSYTEPGWISPTEYSDSYVSWEFTEIDGYWSQNLYFKADIIDCYCNNISNIVVINGTGCLSIIEDSDATWIDIECPDPVGHIDVKKMVKLNYTDDPVDHLNVGINETFLFLIQVVNDAEISIDINITDYMDPALEYYYDAYVDGVPMEPTFYGDYFVWHLDDIAPNQTVNITYEAFGLINGTFGNVVNASPLCDPFDCDCIRVGAHNDEAWVTIEAPPGEYRELSVIKLVKNNDCMSCYDSGLYIGEGDSKELTFKIMIMGHGSFDTISVVDLLPFGLETTDDLIWDFSNKSGDWTETIIFDAEVMDGFCGNVTNVVNVTGSFECDQQLNVSDEAWIHVECEDEPDDIIQVEKLVKPDCDDCGFYQSIVFDYFDDIDFVTYRLMVHIDESMTEPVYNLSVRDNLPQIEGLHYNGSYIRNGSNYPYTDYITTITNEYIYWNFTETVSPGSTFYIYYCADVSGCGIMENWVNVSGMFYDGGPCCPVDIYANDSAIVEIICPSGISMDKMVSLDGSTWLDTGVQTVYDDIVWFKLTIKNIDFTEGVQGVTVYDELPPFLVLEEVIDRDGATVVTEEDHELRWFISYMGPSEIREIIFTARVVDFGEGENLACVYECGEDEWCDDVWVTVEEGLLVDKRVRINDDDPWVDNITGQPGDEISWNITISYFDNSYPPLVLFNIIVNDTLPANMTYVNNSAIVMKSDGWSMNLNPVQDGSVLTWDLSKIGNATLLNGSWISIVFSTSIDDNASAGVLENNVDVTAKRCDATYLFDHDSALVYIEEIINHKPTIINPVPADDEVNVSVDATLSVDVNDTDDDVLSVTFFNASDDSVIQSVSSIDPPQTVTVDWDNLAYNMTYRWYVNVSDGNVTMTSDTFSFTTEQAPDNRPPEIVMTDSPSPDDGEDDVNVNPWLAVHVRDQDIEDTITTTFYRSDGVIIGSDTCSEDCTATVRWSDLDYDTTYSWYVIVSDGTESVRGPSSGFWRFTTETIDIALSIDISGGLGVSLDIENTGMDSASDIAWTIDIESRGPFGRIDVVEGDVIPILGSGATSTKKVSVSGFGRVEIIATASADYADPQEITTNAFVIGPLVLIR